MTAYGRFRKAQRMVTPENGGAGRKQARQAVLQRVRQVPGLLWTVLLPETDGRAGVAPEACAVPGGMRDEC